MISIITPNLNGGKFLQGLFKSIDLQRYRDYEHIIIDGGSTDSSLDLIKVYTATNSNITLISEKDEGMYYAINKGLQIARGDILCYLNIDDRYFPWTLEVIAKEFSHNQNMPRLVYGDVLQVWNIEGNQVFYPKVIPSMNQNYLANYGVLAQPSVFWNRTVNDLIGGFDTHYSLLADCEYWLHCISSKKVVINKLDEFLSIELNHPANLREKNKEILIAERRNLRYQYSKSSILNVVGLTGIRYKYWGSIKLFIRVFLNIPKSKWKMFLEYVTLKIKLKKNYHLSNTYIITSSEKHCFAQFSELCKFSA